MDRAVQAANGVSSIIIHRLHNPCHLGLGEEVDVHLWKVTLSFDIMLLNLICLLIKVHKVVIGSEADCFVKYMGLTA